MKLRSLVCLTIVGFALGALSAVAQTAAKKTAAPKSAAPKSVSKTAATKAAPKAQPKTAAPASKTALKSTPTKKPATSGKASATASRTGKTAKGKASVNRAAYQPRQSAPTPDRLKEIQGALASKGYLKSEPSGVWNAESIDAMKRYQADQKLDPSGKITAASLIGLGLGSSTGTPLPPAAPTTPIQP